MNNEVITILLEAAEASKKKRYKCPFCETRLEREKLVDHIDKDHEDLISDEYTAARLVFNIVNKKDHGNCTVCGKETPWNESFWRYERFCINNNDACKKKAGLQAKANMKKVYGKEHLLDDDEVQRNMLSNRAISGTYKFSRGGNVSYVGTYERKLFEFADEVMGYNSSDWMSPGPSIEYEYKGKKHTWITDQYLIPFNLIFDVKDGGSNPNNRDMGDYREKQIAKEEAIKKLGKYNYIRLTDNDFSQLLYILAEIKAQMMDVIDSKDPIIHINESTNLEVDLLENVKKIKIEDFNSVMEYCSAVVGITNSVYVVPYMQKNTLEIDYGLTSGIFDPVIIMDKFGEVTVKENTFLKEDCEVYAMFKFTKRSDNTKIVHSPNNLFELATGKELMTPEQLLKDGDFEQVVTFDDMLMYADECFTRFLLPEKYKIPVVGECAYDNIIFYRDENGVFAENATNGMRCNSRKNKSDIPDRLLSYLSVGKL